ncbi:MAG: TadE/TadG family type IV pilus assembly protein [Acidobacteria bacterium]|nr:TadE/TadG family type IV pilus assembly protein [Acidobacteriota bacterium]
MTNPLTQNNRRRGNALVELAVTVPFLFLLTMGAADFGRLFYHALTVTHAAGVASEFAAYDNLHAVDYSGTQAVALADAFEVKGATATATHVCVCTAGGTPGSCDLDACGGLPPRVYVKVTVEDDFKTMGSYPSIPDSTLIGRDAWRRVQ